MPSTLLPASMLLRIGCQEFSTWRIYSGQLQKKRKLQQVPAVGLGPGSLNTSVSAPGAPPTAGEPEAPIKVQTLKQGQATKLRTSHASRLSAGDPDADSSNLSDSAKSPQSLPVPCTPFWTQNMEAQKKCPRNQPSQQTYHPTTEHLRSFLAWGRVTRKSWIREAVFRRGRQIGVCLPGTTSQLDSMLIISQLDPYRLQREDTELRIPTTCP